MRVCVLHASGCRWPTPSPLLTRTCCTRRPLPNSIKITALREQLAALLEYQEQWTEAARALMAIPLESGQRALSADYKAGVYVHIVRLLLEDDDHVEAEAYMNRAAVVMHEVKDQVLLLSFKV